jgi:carboxymethylenebutenolidase
MTDITREDLLALVTNKTGWTRRQFVASLLATGFALAVQPVCAQSVITTDTQGLW